MVYNKYHMSIFQLSFGVYIFDYYTTVKLPKNNKKQNLSIFIISAFLVRIIFALFFKGHETDLWYFLWLFNKYDKILYCHYKFVSFCVVHYCGFKYFLILSSLLLI